MSDEMFTQILALVEQAGEGGMILAILYMGIAYFQTIVWSGVWIFIILTVYRIIGNVFFLSDMMRAAGIRNTPDPTNAKDREEFAKFVRRHAIN